MVFPCVFDDLFALQDPRRMVPVGPSEGASTLLVPKLEVDTNTSLSSGFSAADAPTGTRSLRSEVIAPTNWRDPRATLYMRANRSSVGPSYVQVKQESVQEPVELERIDITDPAHPLSPLPRSGIPLAQGTGATI